MDLRPHSAANFCVLDVTILKLVFGCCPATPQVAKPNEISMAEMRVL